MGNFIFGSNFIEPTVETVSSEDSSHPWADAKNYRQLRWDFNALVATEVTVVCNFGSAKTLLGLFLNDVNFTSVTIQGNATDSWGSPSYSETFTISKNALTQRYQIYCALVAFTYPYLRIKIPTQSPTSGTVFKVGTRVFIGTKLELTTNPSMGYDRGAAYPEAEVNKFKSGGQEVISQGDYKIWEGTFSFDNLSWTNEADLWTLDAFQPDECLVLYENRGYTSAAYLVRKETPIKVSWPRNKVAESSSITFREVI